MVLPFTYWLAGILIFVLPAWLFSRILTKTGYPAWYAVAGLIPLVNVVALWLLAFSDWPSERRE